METTFGNRNDNMAFIIKIFVMNGMYDIEERYESYGRAAKLYKAGMFAAYREVYELIESMMEERN